MWNSKYIKSARRTWDRFFWTVKSSDTARIDVTYSLMLELSRFVGLVTGHGNLAYFYSKLEPGSNPICRLCREWNETFIRFMECPRLRTYQTDCFLDKDISQGWEEEKVLEFSYKRGINEAVEWIMRVTIAYSVYQAVRTPSCTHSLNQIEILPRTRADKKKMTTRSQL